MRKYIKIILTGFFITFALYFLVFAEEDEGETFTITTYYPSPYGSYNELTTYSNTYLAIKSGNVGIGTTSPASKLTLVGGYIQGTAETWGHQARTQGIIIMPEGTVTDNGAGKVILGGAIIVMNPLAGSYIRIASGTYTFAPWSYMWINIPPTGTRATTVIPTISGWSDTDRPYDGRDRIIIGQRQASGKVYWKFGIAPASGYNWVQCAHFVDTAATDIAWSWAAGCNGHANYRYACKKSGGVWGVDVILTAAQGYSFSSDFFNPPGQRIASCQGTSSCGPQATSNCSSCNGATGYQVASPYGNVFWYVLPGEEWVGSEGEYCGSQDQYNQTGDEYWIYYSD